MRRPRAAAPRRSRAATLLLPVKAVASCACDPTDNRIPHRIGAIAPATDRAGIADGERPLGAIGTCARSGTVP